MSEKTNVQKTENELLSLLKNNVRNYMMYIVLIVIMVFFQIWSKGSFFKASNISNLFNQAAYVAVLAIGMTLILIIRHIELSVGFVAGFCGAVAAILLEKQGWNVWLVIPTILLLGLLIGFYHGTGVTRVGVPAFVMTLAGQFIFRGLLSLSLSKTGTIVVRNETFLKLCNGFIPDIPHEGGLHIVTLLIGVVAIILIILSMFKNRNNRIKYGFKVMSMPLFIIEIVIIAVVIMIVAYTLAAYKGLPWSSVIVGVILFAYNYMLNKTQLGRYIYGIGGNDQAAELSGVNVKNVTLFCFCSIGVLAALSGMLYTSRLSSASPQAGMGFETEAIASSFIGGTAVSGGVGKVTNAIIGTFVIISLTNGMNLVGVDISYQYIVKGIIFILAVAFDVRTRNR